MGQVKAPEKLYITNDETRFGDKCHSASTEEYIDDDIEYIRKDAFIEKAENYLRNKCQRFILTAKDIEDFVKFMKE